jgi:hypothetical protein
MRFRTLVLALALGCGLTVAGEAKQKHVSQKVHKVSAKKNRGYKQNRANAVKPRKAPKVKTRKVKHNA